MDYSTVKNKLVINAYLSQEEFKEDILLIYSNCILFNSEFSFIGQIASKTRDYFLRIFEEYFD